MIDGFENITDKLTRYETDILLPAFIKSFRRHIGKANAITNKDIIAALKPKGYKLSDVVVRKLVNYIRTHGSVPGLVASSAGYYVTMDAGEVRRYIDSLDGREKAIRAVKENFRAYLKTLIEYKNSYLPYKD